MDDKEKAYCLAGVLRLLAADTLAFYIKADNKNNTKA